MRTIWNYLTFSTRSLKISGCKRWCPKDLWICAPATPVLTHCLSSQLELELNSPLWQMIAAVEFLQKKAYYDCKSCRWQSVKVSFTFPLSICTWFFFQAEDGIRDLVRSRGLGDVYKRQESKWFPWSFRIRIFRNPLFHKLVTGHRECVRAGASGARTCRSLGDHLLHPLILRLLVPVSYTHLTLPTKRIV